MIAESKIREALELLRERGWCQGAFETPDGRLCIEGALDTALGNESHGWSFETAIGSLDLEALDAATGGDFVTFNDHPDTTFADVEAVMEKAAVMREGAVE